MMTELGEDASAVPIGPLGLLAWVGVALAFVELVYFGGSSNFLASPQARIVTQVVVLAAIAAWALGGAGAAAGRSSLIGPATVVLVAVVLAGLFSERPGPAREAVALLLLVLPGYLVVRSVVWDPAIGPRLETLFAAAAVVTLVLYLALSLGLWVEWWSIVGPSIPPLRPGDLGLTLGSSNTVAAAIELLAPTAALIAWQRRHSRLLTGLIVGLTLAALVMTGSRGAWLGAAAGVLLLLAWGIRERGLGGLIPADRRRRVLLGAGLLVLAIPVGVLVVGRLLGSDAGRVELWRAAWSIFTSAPILGGGPGSWPDLHAGQPISGPTYAVLYTPHSSLFLILAELGLVGLAATAWLGIAIARLVQRALRASPAAGTLASAAGRIASPASAAVAGATLLALGVHSLVDPMWHIPGIAALTMIVVARLDRPSTGVDEPARAATLEPTSAPFGGFIRRLEGSGRRARAWPALLAVVSALLLIPVDVAMVHGQLAANALDRADWTTARSEAEAAIALDARVPYRVWAAIAASRLDQPGAAIQQLELAAQEAPFTFITASEAVIRDGQGDRAGALVASNEVLALHAYDPAATLAVALELWRLGDHDRATGALADVFSGVPSLMASSPPGGAFDAAAWTAASSAMVANVGTAPVPQAGAVAAFWATRAHLPDALARVEALPQGPERSILRRLYDAEAGGAPDLAGALNDLRADPTSMIVVPVFDRLARISGSAVDVERAAMLSVILTGSPPTPDFYMVLDGSPRPYIVMALPRWPNASDSRLRAARPFVAGFPTIEAPDQFLAQ
jgi:O-antigen ligase